MTENMFRNHEKDVYNYVYGYNVDFHITNLYIYILLSDFPL